MEAHSCVRGNLFVHSFTQPVSIANLLMHQVLCEVWERVANKIETLLHSWSLHHGELGPRNCIFP